VKGWVVRVTLTVDGRELPERTFRAESRRALPALRAGVVAAIMAEGLDRDSSRVTALRVRVDPVRGT